MNRKPENDLEALLKILKGNTIWVIVTFVVLVTFLFNTFRYGKVTGEDVGILLNNFTNKMTVIKHAGIQWYISLFTDFYKLDKTLQTLEMTDDVNKGDRYGKDDIKIKTKDGSDVYVDLKVQYSIIPDKADVVLKTSGAGNAFKMKWARDYVRAVTRNFLGKLTTEEFYIARKRNKQVRDAKELINKQLVKYGLELDSIVIFKRPRFYK
mgnify:CR=1 FL=1